MIQAVRRSWALALLQVALLFFASVRFPFLAATSYAAGKSDASADWPMYGYDPGHSNFNAQEHLLGPNNVGGLTLKWTLPTQEQNYTTSPAIVDGSLYVGGGNLSALDAVTGAVKWWRVVSSAGTPTVKNGTLYARAGSACLSTFDKNNGTLRWSFCGTSSSPLIINNMLYLIHQSHIVALDASTGIVKWTFDSEGGFTPSYADGVLYIASGSLVYALDAETGKLLWGTSARGYFVSTLSIDHGVLYAAANDNKLYAINAQTGIIKWVYDLHQEAHSALAIANGIVYVVSNRTLYALNEQRGELAWSYDAADAIQTSPVVANGVVYFSANDGQLYAVHAMQGTFLMSTTISVNRYLSPAEGSSPVVANGRVYILSFGILYAFGLASS